MAQYILLFYIYYLIYVCELAFEMTLNNMAGFVFSKPIASNYKRKTNFKHSYQILKFTCIEFLSL